MSCLCDENLIFPSQLACVVRDGFSTSYKRQEKYYLGTKQKSVKEEKEVNVTIFFKDENDVKTFWDWYKNDLQNGLCAFNIELPFFGKNETRKVKFKDDFKESNFLGATRELQTTLIVDPKCGKFYDECNVTITLQGFIDNNIETELTFKDNGDKKHKFPKFNYDFVFEINIPQGYYIKNATSNGVINDNNIDIIDDINGIIKINLEQNIKNFTLTINLEKIVLLHYKNLILNKNNIDEYTNSFFNIRYDADQYNYISDGTYDVYDTGNKIYFNTGDGYQQRQYKEDVINGYVYRKRGIMIWWGQGVISCKTDGNLGSDSETVRQKFVDSFVHDDITYSVVTVMSDDNSSNYGDPSIWRMVIAKEEPDTSYEADGNDSDRHEFIFSETQEYVVFVQFWVLNRDTFPYTPLQIAKKLLGVE